MYEKVTLTYNLYLFCNFLQNQRCASSKKVRTFMKSKLLSSVALFKNVAVATLLAGALSSGYAGTQSFEVLAKENSTAALPLDTGLAFNLGDALQVTATGSWFGGGCGTVGPDGTNCWTIDGINAFSLVGRVGNGDYFQIGSNYAGTASSSGNLFLGFYDTDSYNNTGSVTATVMTAAVPEPETYAMLIAGLGALAFVARRKSNSQR